ncbi:MAG: hypothetical protein QG593_636 [Patescibacteria group bacterium]|nr:hypothetical protein [Patescibacteria group bacterium]
MNEKIAKEILDKIVKQVFGVDNPLSLQQMVEKFTFDLNLPNKVIDSTDGSETWSSSRSATKFTKMENARNNGNNFDGLYATQPIKNLSDILAKWQHINLITTEFALDSINFAESDMIIESEDVFHSRDIIKSKNILYSDTVMDSEFVFASQGSAQVTYCIRDESSIRCANSFGTTRSADLTNCIMMHDCGDMQDSMFCSNMKGRRFCIANMQFDEAEYRRLREQVVGWILSPGS